MGLFKQDRQTDLMLAVEYLRALLKANATKEQAIYQAARLDLKIATIFSDIDKEIQAGKQRQEVIETKVAATKDPATKRLLEIMGATDGVELEPLLQQLSQELSEKKKTRNKTLEDSRGKGLSRILTLIGLPIILFFLYMAQPMAADLGIDLSAYMKYIPIILAIDLALVFISLMMMEAQ